VVTNLTTFERLVLAALLLILRHQRRPKGSLHSDYDPKQLEVEDSIMHVLVPDPPPTAPRG